MTVFGLGAQLHRSGLRWSFAPAAFTLGILGWVCAAVLLLWVLALSVTKDMVEHVRFRGVERFNPLPPVSEIAEVTQAFNTYPVERAIEWALKGAPVDYHCRSDFGFAFSRFTKTELDSLDRKTTILVLGDARNNYNDPRAWCLREIHTKAKNVVWLNPENPSAWGFGDSVMDKYLPYTDVAEECRNLRQLSKVVDGLLL